MSSDAKTVPGNAKTQHSDHSEQKYNVGKNDRNQPNFTKTAIVVSLASSFSATF